MKNNFGMMDLDPSDKDYEGNDIRDLPILCYPSLSFKKDKKGNPWQLVKLGFIQGRNVSFDLDSSLVRPYTQLFEEGIPPNPIRFVFHKEPEKWFVLGSFSTSKDHILFFPGIKRMNLMTPPREYLKKKKLDLIMHHLSLKRDLSAWHITDISKHTSKQKLQHEKLGKITNSLYSWFQWGILPNQLESLPNVQIIPLDDKEKKTKHISDNIFNSADMGPIPFTHSKEKLKESHYWHFEFFISTNKDDERETLAKVGINPMYMKEAPKIVSEKRKIVQSQIIQLDIPNFEGLIYILSTKIIASVPAQSFMVPGGMLPRENLFPSNKLYKPILKND